MKNFFLGLLVGILGIVLVIVLVGFAMVRLASTMGGERPVSVSDNSALILNLEGAVPEQAPVEVAIPFLQQQPPLTVLDTWKLLRRATSDARVKALVLEPRGLDAGWAKLEELRAEIVAFKQSGKPVYAFLRNAGTREYYLATAADKIYLPPSSALDLTGVADYELFLRGTFDKLGAYPDFIHIGDYKTATNQLTEKKMTAAHREMSESLNHDMFAQLVRAIAEGRHKTEADVRALVDDGPFLPKRALEAGLVDGVAYLRVLPVQVRLLAVEQVQVVLAGGRVPFPRRAPEEGGPVVRLRTVTGVAPKVPIPLRIFARRTRFGEPRVLIGGVVDHQIHHQLHPQFVHPRQ